MLSSAEVDVFVAYRLVELFDGEVEEALPTPHQAGHPWLGVGNSGVLLESAEDISRARFNFELWDGQPPELNDADWPVSDVVMLSLPSGVLSVREISLGGIPEVFDVGAPGRYRVRLAWRAGELDSEGSDPEAFALAQFWRDPTG